jgi:hypothetical protein
VEVLTMTVKIDVPQECLPHLQSQELLGDIWFYRTDCRYLQDAWLEHPFGYESANLFNNENEEVFVRAHGNFAIPASFYLAPPDDDAEYATFRHFNAVDSNLCFNQLAYVLSMEGCKSGLVPLGKFGVDPEHLRCRKVAVNMMIAKINTTFVRPINPSGFTGWIAIRTIYERKGMPFMEMEFQFSDYEGPGLAVGECRGVVFVQNFCMDPDHPGGCGD